MEIFLGIVGALLLTGLIALFVEFVVPSLILKLAGYDTVWSPYRMRASPGDVIMMAKGKPNGAFDRVLPSDIPEWHYHKGDERFYHIGKIDAEKKLFKEKFPDGAPQPSGYLAKYGVVYVGFFKRYYRRRRRWENWEFNPQEKKWTMVSKDTEEKKDDNLFHFSTTMAIEVKNVYTKDFYPVSFKVIFNVLLIAPRKAEFVAGKSEVQANAAVLSRAREYVGGKSIHELRAERDSGNLDDFVDRIIRSNEKHSDETNTVALLPDYGVMLQGPQLVEPDFESGDKDMNDAIQRRMIAGEDLETAKIRALEEAEKGKGAANRRREEAVGIRDEFAARMSVPQGAELSLAEAIRVSEPDTIVLGSSMPVALPLKTSSGT